MKKVILIVISMLPFANISMAASIKLNEISQEEKIQIIREVVQENPNLDIGEIKTGADIDKALQKLIHNGFILDGAGVKKGSGGESAGIGGL